MTDDELAADELTRLRAGIQQIRDATTQLSRTNHLDGLTLQQFCDRLLDPAAFAEAERLRAERRAG